MVVVRGRGGGGEAGKVGAVRAPHHTNVNKICVTLWSNTNFLILRCFFSQCRWLFANFFIIKKPVVGSSFRRCLRFSVSLA